MPFPNIEQPIGVAMNQAATHSTILMKMKEIVEVYPGSTIRNVVVIVHVYFNESQCQAAKDASVIFGLNMMRTIHVPTTSAIV